MATDRRNIPEPRRTIFRGCQHHSAVGTELRGINPTFVGHRLAAICWFLSIIILRKRAPDCERLVTVSPVASAAATNRSNTGPEFPGRSLTDISRNRFGGNGRTIRRRRPSLSASSSAIKSAPHAAEQTSRRPAMAITESHLICFLFPIFCDLSEFFCCVETAFGSEKVRTLLMIVLRNATTDSPWPISNNPNAKFNLPGTPGRNSDLALWKLVRANTAAPTYFPPETIKVDPHEFVFVDGGVTMYNNPAFQLFLMATTEPYRLCWPTGEEKMLLISVGTGASPNAFT